MAMQSADALAVVLRLQQAINQHDLDALAACFASDFQSEQPLHPDRAFRGREQMRTNWAQIFAGVPNIQTTLLRSASDGDTVWAEWDWRGTRLDGGPFALRGVTIQSIEAGQIAWVRLYMESVQQGSGVDAAIRQTVTGE